MLGWRPINKGSFMVKSSALFFLALGLSYQAFAGPMNDIRSEKELNAYLVESAFNGVVLVQKDNNVLLRKAFGYKNLETKEALSVSDKFQIGSNTKQFVAASLLKLQEKGLISLEDKLTKYFPEFPQYKNIRIKDILNHTAGIPNYTDIKEFWENLDSEKVISSEEIMAFVKDLPLEFEVGSNWNYSNSGYILAGDIIKRVTGQTWDEYVQENFLTPLKMTNSGYKLHFEEVSDVMNYVLDNGKLTPIQPPFNLSWASSAGALYSTVDDMVKWTAIYDDSVLLSESSKKDMQTPTFGYGLGVMIGRALNDIKIFHSGRTPGFTSQLSYLKKAKLKAVVLNNVDGRVGVVADALVDFYGYGKASVLKTKTYSLSLDEMNDFVGEFAGGGFIVKVFVSEGKIFLHPNGQRPYEMKANDKDSFNLEDFAGEEFIRDNEGKVIGIKHYQSNAETYFKKM